MKIIVSKDIEKILILIKISIKIKSNFSEDMCEGI